MTMAAANALPPAVACRAVAKVYGEGETTVHALRGIDLLIQPGELMMLVGPSGCGKTTLISIIAGILEKTAGDCLVFGKNLSAMTPGERAAWRRDHAGFVFQSFNLMPALTATENVASNEFVVINDAMAPHKPPGEPPVKAVRESGA